MRFCNFDGAKISIFFEKSKKNKKKFAFFIKKTYICTREMTKTYHFLTFPLHFCKKMANRHCQMEVLYGYILSYNLCLFIN